MIRLPDLPPVPNSAIGAPEMSARAAGAQGAALGAAADAIGSVSSAFYGEAIRLQRVENARSLSEARSNLARAYAEHQLSLQSDLDPLSRMEKTRAFIASAQGGAFLPADAPPEVADQWQSHVSEWAGNAEIHQAEDSARLTVRRAKAAFENEMDMAQAANDRGQLERAVNTAVESGILLPEEGEPIVRGFDRNADLTTLQGAIEQEPKLVLEDMDKDDFSARFPNLNMQDMGRIRRAAEAEVQRKRGEELDLIEGALIEGTLTVEDIEAAEYLTPKDTAQVKKSLLASEPPDLSKHSAAWDLLFRLRDAGKDPAISDTKYAEIWNATRAQVLAMMPKGFQGDLTQELAYRSPANRTAEKNTPASSRGAESMASEHKSLATERIKKAYDSGALGDISDPKSDAAQKAYRRFEDARVSVWAWLKDNPTATWPDIRTHIGKTLGAVIAGEKPLISLPAAPPPVSFDERATRALGLPAQGKSETSAALLPPP